MSLQFEGVVPPLMADGMTKDASRNGIFEIPIMIDRWEFEVGVQKRLFAAAHHEICSRKAMIGSTAIMHHKTSLFGIFTATAERLCRRYMGTP